MNKSFLFRILSFSFFIFYNNSCTTDHWIIKKVVGIKGMDEKLTKMILVIDSTGYILGALYNQDYPINKNYIYRDL